MAENFGIGLRVQLKTSKADIDRQITLIQEKVNKSINLNVKVDVTKKDVISQLKNITDKPIADVTLRVKIDDKTKYINDQIRALSTKINETLTIKLKIDTSEVMMEAQKAKRKTQEAMAQSSSPNTITQAPEQKWNPAMVSGAERKAIENSIIQTLGIAEGKITKITADLSQGLGFKKAVVEYTNDVGKAVTETLRWENVLNKATGKVEKVFGTSNIKVVDNMKQAEKSTENFDIKVAKLLADLAKIGTSGMKFDTTAFSKIEQSILNLKNGAKGVKTEMADISNAISAMTVKAKAQTALYNNALAVANRTSVREKEGVASLKYSGISEAGMKKSIDAYMASTFAGKSFDIKSLGNINSTLGGISKDIGQAIVKIYDGKKIHEFKVLADSATNTVRAFATETKNISTKDMGFGGKLQNAIEGFPIWMIAATAWMQALNGLKDGIKYIYEMDTAMTDLGKVTDFTSGQMEGLRQSALKTGQDLGKSSVDIMKSYAEIGRVHKDTTDIVELGRVDKVAPLCSNT